MNKSSLFNIENSIVPLSSAIYFLGSDEGGDDMQLFFNIEDCVATESEYIDVFKKDGTKLKTFKFTEEGYTTNF